MHICIGKIDFKEKESKGEFNPKGPSDTLQMVLGKDHPGRVRGEGGVRLGVKKEFGAEFVSNTQSNTTLGAADVQSITQLISRQVSQEVMEKMNKKISAILA